MNGSACEITKCSDLWGHWKGPLTLIALLGALIYWFQLVKMPINIHPKQASLVLINISLPTGLNWARDMDEFLSRIGYTLVRANGECANERRVIQPVEQK